MLCFDRSIQTNYKHIQQEGGGHGQSQEELTRKCVCKVEESKISVTTDGSVLLGGTEGDKNGRVQG
jgi:hypothetical protein